MEKRQVLLIDDEWKTQGLDKLVESSLTEGEYEIIPEAGWQRAVEHIRAGRTVDVVLLDYDLGEPEVTGISVLRQIKAHDPSLPVIMLSIRLSPKLVQVALNQGALFYCDKAELHKRSPMLQTSVDWALANLSEREFQKRIQVLQASAQARLTADRIESIHRLLQRSLDAQMLFHVHRFESESLQMSPQLPAGIEDLRRSLLLTGSAVAACQSAEVLLDGLEYSLRNNPDYSRLRKERKAPGAIPGSRLAISILAEIGEVTRWQAEGLHRLRSLRNLVAHALLETPLDRDADAALVLDLALSILEDCWLNPEDQQRTLDGCRRYREWDLIKRISGIGASLGPATDSLRGSAQRMESQPAASIEHSAQVFWMILRDVASELSRLDYLVPEEYIAGGPVGPDAARRFSEEAKYAIRNNLELEGTPASGVWIRSEKMFFPDYYPALFTWLQGLRGESKPRDACLALRASLASAEWYVREFRVWSSSIRKKPRWARGPAKAGA